MDAPLNFMTSPNGTGWTFPKNIVNGYTDYGLQMAVHKGTLYGVMTQTVQYPGTLFLISYVNGSWKQPWVTLPNSVPASGRVGVTVMDDRFYIVWRGASDNNVYMMYTDDFSDWTQVGRIGYEYHKTMVAPAIGSFNGSLYVTCVREDKYIYFVLLKKNGERKTLWIQIKGTGTQSALNMCTYNDKLYLIHTSYNNDKIFYQTLKNEKKFSDLQSVDAKITSGVAACAMPTGGQMLLTYRNPQDLVTVRKFDGTNFGPEVSVYYAVMRFQTGVAAFGNQIMLSFSKKNQYGNTKKVSEKMAYFNEKTGLYEDESDDEDDWDVAWKSGASQKSWLSKFFHCF